jgi:hypothetical protein
VSGMKQQRGAAFDADIAQAQEQRAVRLAMALDAKQLAAGKSGPSARELWSGGRQRARH